MARAVAKEQDTKAHTIHTPDQSRGHLRACPLSSLPPTTNLLILGRFIEVVRPIPRPQQARHRSNPNQRVELWILRREWGLNKSGGGKAKRRASPRHKHTQPLTSTTHLRSCHSAKGSCRRTGRRRQRRDGGRRPQAQQQSPRGHDARRTWCS